MNADELFCKHQPALLRYLTRYTGDPEVAADATQHAYLKLVESPPREEDNLRAWLFTVATNVVHDGWRHDGRTGRLIQSAESLLEPQRPPDPQASAEHAERLELARTMLTRVSDKERTILLMWVEGFAHKEIAQAVGTTTGTIGPTIARALKKLSKQIDRFMQEDV